LRDRQDAKTPRREPDEEVDNATERQLGLLINFDVAALASGVRRVLLGPVA